MQVIPGRYTLFNFYRRTAPVAQGVDERHEEVVSTIAELLDIGVLIGAALVAENRKPLVDNVPVAVPRFAKRLHYKLLQKLR